METLYFVLGMLSVAVVMAVVSVFRIKSELKEFANTEKDLYDRIDMIERRIDQEIDRVDKINHKHYEYADKLYQNHEDNLNELYKYVDSRTDKMADGISKHIADLNAKFNDNTAFVDLLSHKVNDLKK
jgi:DNA helicase IV